jgi:creatinine amidohydrolase/Fe(II)-dependent formamide hydrolase-like protein
VAESLRGAKVERLFLANGHGGNDVLSSMVQATSPGRA